MRHDFVLALKRVLYSRRGEPTLRCHEDAIHTYRIDGWTLRYLPGTRPVRLRYARSQNGVARYDALQVAWLSTHLTEGETAVDIGAHYGQTGHVVAFEPDPYACEVLGVFTRTQVRGVSLARSAVVKNLSLNPGIKRPVIEACACSDSTGETTLFSRRGNAQSSRVTRGTRLLPTRAQPGQSPVG